MLRHVYSYVSRSISWTVPCLIACAQRMNGRFFAGQRIEASLYTGKQRFKRTGTGDDFGGEIDEAEQSRLDKFANWLLTEDD